MEPREINGPVKMFVGDLASEGLIGNLVGEVVGGNPVWTNTTKYEWKDSVPSLNLTTYPITPSKAATRIHLNVGGRKMDVIRFSVPQPITDGQVNKFNHGFQYFYTSVLPRVPK